MLKMSVERWYSHNPCWKPDGCLMVAILRLPSLILQDWEQPETE